MTDESSKERQILMVMRKVLAAVIKDTTPPNRGNFLGQSHLFEFAEMQMMQVRVTAVGRSGHGGLLD